MILSSHISRTIRKTLNLRLPGRARAPRGEDAPRAAEERPRPDPDWAIREIVDEALFEPAR